MTDFGMSRVSVISDEEVTTDGNTYYERKAEGRCVYPGCPRQASDESVLCPEHRDDARARTRKSQKRIRAERRAADLCPRCGEKAKGDYMCVRCKVKYGRTKRARTGGDDNREHNRIADRLIPWENSPHNAGRLRLRGGKRGAPNIDAQDEFERKIVKTAIARYAEACDMLASDDGKAMLPRDRDAARMAALGQLALAVRAAEDILDRNRYEQKLQKAKYDRSAGLSRTAREIAKSGR